MLKTNNTVVETTSQKYLNIYKYIPNILWGIIKIKKLKGSLKV